MTDFLVSISPLIIDDILTCNGDAHLGLLGGAGAHALAGCRVWHKQLGIIAVVGADYSEYAGVFRKLGVDTSGLQVIGERTTRAWQLFQQDGDRLQVLHDPRAGIPQAIPNFEKLPDAYCKARGYHFFWRGRDKHLMTVLRHIRTVNPTATIALEPAPSGRSKRREYYQDLFGLIDVFSPNLEDARAITGQQQPKSILNVFLNAGCKSIVVRAGEGGSFAITQNGAALYVPAAPAAVVDVTGAGNAFVGGLLSGLALGKSYIESLAMASVSASFEIEQFGVGYFNEAKLPIRDKRLSMVMKGIRILK
jgi:sugar/nucleoside kinase (ribokinase family)